MRRLIGIAGESRMAGTNFVLFVLVSACGLGAAACGSPGTVEQTAVVAALTIDECIENAVGGKDAVCHRTFGERPYRRIVVAGRACIEAHANHSEDFIDMSPAGDCSCIGSGQQCHAAAPCCSGTCEDGTCAFPLRWRTRPDSQEEADIYDGISKDVDDELEGITLTYEPGEFYNDQGVSYTDVLMTELAAGAGPDVMWIAAADIGGFAEGGLILNLYDLAHNTPGFDGNDFYSGPMKALTSGDNNLWGLPRDVSTFVLYLNQDLLEAAGASDPIALAKLGTWDWDAFLEVAKKVRAHALVAGEGIYGYGEYPWWGPYGTWMNAAGGGFFNEAGDACHLDSTSSLVGLQFERDLYQESPKVAVPYGWDNENSFIDGKVGMFQNGRWSTPYYRNGLAFHWDVVELPRGPSGHAGNWQFWGAYAVNARTKYPEQAWELVQKLTAANVQVQISSMGTNIPSRQSQEAINAFLNFTPPANNQAFINGLQDNAVAEGPVWKGSWPDYAFEAVMAGNMTVDEFAADICDKLNDPAPP